MPSNEDFSLEILVGPSVLPEYQHDGNVYVESNLFTPYSYKQHGQQLVSGEVEAQKWPVTPFVISLEAKPNTPPCYYRVSIDGQKVKGISLYRCEKKVIKGFKDGTTVREFLFSLPRFANDLDDRIDITCRNKVGTIEVECYNAKKRQSQKRLQAQSLVFEQANKKDSTSITEGKYLMATTKAGRVIHNRNAFKTTDFWDVLSLRSKLTIKYVTKETLQEMGLDVIPIPFPIASHTLPGSRRSLSDSGISLTPESKVKCELVDGGTVVLDLTGEISGCSSSMPGVKVEMDLSMSRNDDYNAHTSSSTRIHTFSLPAEMNNAMIDLTEDEENQSLETVDNSVHSMDISGVDESIEKCQNEEENSNTNDKDEEESENEEIQMAAKKRKINCDHDGKESEDSVTGVTQSDKNITGVAQNEKNLSGVAQSEEIVDSVAHREEIERGINSVALAESKENVSFVENSEENVSSIVQSVSEETVSEVALLKKNINDENEKKTSSGLTLECENVQKKEKENDSENSDQIKEMDCGNESDKEGKDADGENLGHTVDKNIEDCGIGGPLDNGSENDTQNDKQSEKNKDNENELVS